MGAQCDVGAARHALNRQYQAKMAAE
jgi:hypothetical protein